MRLIKQIRWLLLIAVGIAGSLSAQESVLSLIPFDGQASSHLNAQIATDTTANGGIPANRVYELQRGGIYLASALFNVDSGRTLRLRANSGSGARPIIYLYPTGTGANPARPPGYLFQLRGGKLDMRNISISGYFEPVDTNFNNIQGGIINTSTPGASMWIDSCVFVHIAGQHLRTGSAVVTVSVTNSIFADMGALSTSNFGAGKGIDLRDVSVDTLLFVNNTFVNYQDRVIRHYNFGNPTAGTGAMRYLKFDHNTVVNGMSFHGLFSLGSMGSRAIITNNLFIDPFASGEDSADATRQAEWANTGEKYPNGSNRMTWIFTAPNDTTVWTIKNNHYSISDSGQAFLTGLAGTGVLGEGKALSWHINSRLGGDSVSAFTGASSPILLTKIPKLMLNMMRWYRDPNGGNLTKNTPTSKWVRAQHDMDRHRVQYYTDTLDCTYSTGIAAYTAASGGFPLGDLNWFPTKKAEWAASVFTGVTPEDVIPESFTLTQNYPNPFNPTTRFTYDVPRAADIRLEVFDLLGRVVATLYDGPQNAGSFEVDFDASRLGTGVYFYRLTTPGQTITKRMLLMK